MKANYDPTLKATVTLDDAGCIRGINHLDEYREIEHLRGREAAAAYVRDIAGKLNIAREQLHSIEQAVSYLDPQERGVEYRFSKEKTLNPEVIPQREADKLEEESYRFGGRECP